MSPDEDVETRSQPEVAELRPAVGTTDEPRGPGIGVHVVVLAISAIAAFFAYSLLS